jgi:CRISPR-associated endonuclease Csn1
VAVSHKPDTGWQAALHNDTAYGIIEGAGPKQPNVVVRKPLASLVDWEEKDILAGVRDSALAARIAGAIRGKEGKERAAALAALRHSNGSEIRSVRVVDRLNVFALIRDRQEGKAYKAVKLDGNHRAELWRLPDGNIRLEVITTFDAAQEAEAQRLGRKVPDLRPHPAAKLLLRLHKSDAVAFGIGLERKLLTVTQMSPGKILFAPLYEGGNLRDRHRDHNDSFKYIQTGAGRLIDEKVRKIHVTPDGHVRDPGPSP